MFNSLKSKVLGSFLILVIIPMLIGSAVIFYQVKNAEIEQIDSTHNIMIKNLSLEFENYVRYNVDLLKFTTQNFFTKMNDNKFVSQMLTSQLMANHNFDEIILLDPEGVEQVHIHRYKTFGVEHHNDLSKSILFVFPKLNKALYLGKITFVEETGEPVADIAFGVKDPQSGLLQGVIVAKLRLKPVWNMLANVNFQEGQEMFILDNDHRIVAHPVPSVVLKNISFTPRKNGFTTGLHGNEVYMKYIKINIANQVFTIVSQQKKEDALKLLLNVSFVIQIVVLCVLAMSFTLMYLSVKHFVKPINELSTAAQDIEHGDLNRVVNIEGQDEIARLANSFNKMTSKLKENTAQLKSFNLGLQKKINSEIEKTRKMEQLLFEQKKFADMGQMINAIAHQWRQPLNNIGLIQQYLHTGFTSGTITPEEYEEYTNSQLEIVQNMSATIDDFRTFFTSDKHKDRFNIINALSDFIRLTSAQLNSSGIKFRLQCFACSERHIFDADTLAEKCEKAELSVVGHAGEFKHVIQNIIANARDEFMKNKVEEPFLLISIELDDLNVVAKFRDNAGGIPIDILPNIFDPYFTTKEEGKGTGIGLYISRVIIDDHFGGKLRAVNVEGGAEFIITLPRADKA